VREGVLRVLDSISAPAYVRNNRMDVLAANRLGRALFADVYAAGATAVAAAAIWLYNRCYLQGRTGQSWGKRAVNGQVTFSWPRRRAMGLKLIRMSDKEPVGSWKAAIRNLAHALDNIPTLYLLPIWNARRQTLADKAMKTVVISLRG
jgi:MmyB-like transcription regulator ligand binding domain